MGEILAASAILAAAQGTSSYMQSRAQKEAARKAEESARTQAQLAAEQAPQQSSTSASNAVVKKDEGIKGLRSQLLANRSKVAPIDGDKTLTGQ